MYQDEDYNNKFFDIEGYKRLGSDIINGLLKYVDIV